MAQNEIDNVTTDLENLDFHHPYTPYDVQEQFMKAVYNVLETGNGQVGILESPTGTVSLTQHQSRFWYSPHKIDLSMGRASLLSDLLIINRASRSHSSVLH